MGFNKLIHNTSIEAFLRQSLAHPSSNPNTDPRARILKSMQDRNNRKSTRGFYPLHDSNHFIDILDKALSSIEIAGAGCKLRSLESLILPFSQGCRGMVKT